MSKQSGKIDILIVVLVVVAIIGGLGYAFWNNLKESDDTEVNQEQTRSQGVESEKLVSVETSDAFPTGVTWQYPEGWTLTTEGKDPVSVEETAMWTYQLTSPSGKVKVEYWVGQNGGIGGACAPESSGTIQHLRLADTREEPGLVFLEHIGDAQMEGMQHFHLGAWLVEDKQSIRDLEVGDSVCDTYLTEYVRLPSDATPVILKANILLTELESDGESMADSVDAISEHFSSDEYKQAVDILLSTKIKQ